MALPVMTVRSTPGAVRDVMASYVSSCCATPACSVRVCSAPGAVGSFGRTGLRDEYNSVGEPCAFLGMDSEGSSVRFRAEAVGLFHPLKSIFGYTCISSMRKRSSRIATMAADDEEKGVYRVRKKDGGRYRAGRYATSITMQVDRFKLNQDIELLLRRESRLLPEALVEALHTRIRAGEVEKALKVFQLLRGQEWYIPQQEQYLSLLRMLAERKQFLHASKLWTSMEKDKLPPTVELCTALLNVFVKSERLDAAYELFQRMKSMPNCFPDVYTYTVLIEGFLQAHEVRRVSQLMDDMKQNDIRQNTVTWNTLLASFGRSENFQLIEEAFDEMCISPDTYPDTYSWNIVLKSYGKAGRIRNMEEWYSRMQEMEVPPDMVTFNTLIHVYGRNRQFSKMINVAKHMLGLYFPWNDVTFNTMIEAYGRAQMIEEMEQIHRIMKSKGVKPSAFTLTTLVNSYSKEKMFDKVEKIRREWKNSDVRADVIMYNSFLEAYRRSGNLRLLEETFHELETTLQPDQASYNILASAYRSNGLREKYNEVMAKLNSIPKTAPKLSDQRRDHA